PWPKNRHAKRRLTYHTFLALYQQILNDEGDLHFKTDNRGLFAYSLESMSQFGMYFTKINLNLHQEDDGSNILTEYEKKFSDKGSRIYRMEAKFHSQK
ncbi:TPA: tRNA (guanosine(46)-N7)-methyltransferase TrmB, partial [Staphylococcus aureus]|nr:tRNA (guanosine(46)-N7)-methyltransferase TrmB [Staphylococcus aureus]